MICDAREENLRHETQLRRYTETFLPSRLILLHTRWGVSLAFRELLIAKGKLNKVKPDVLRSCYEPNICSRERQQSSIIESVKGQRCRDSRHSPHHPRADMSVLSQSALRVHTLGMWRRPRWLHLRLGHYQQL